MKNLLRNKNKDYRNQNPYIIAVVRTLVLTTAFFTSTLCSAQNSCEQYFQYLKKIESISIIKLDSTLNQLSHEGYWFEWYNMLREITYLLEEESIPIALEYLKKKEPISSSFDQFIKGEYFDFVSFYESISGNMFSAIEYEKRALEQYKTLKDSLLISRTLKQLSFFYSKFNDHHRSIEYGKLYKNSISGCDSLSLLKLAVAHSNLADYYYYQKKYSKALIHIDSVVHYSKKRHSASLLFKIKVNLAVHDYTKSNNLIEAGLNNSKEKNNRNKLLLLKASLFSAKGKYKQSIRLRNSVLNNADYIKITDRRDFMKQVQLQAEDHYKNSNYQLALKYTHQLQNFFCSDFKQENPFETPDSSELIPEAWLMESLYTKAKVFEKIKGPSPIDILSTYDKAIYVLDLLREQFSVMGSVHDISETDQKIFEDAILYCYKEYSKTKNKFYLNKALKYSQASKAFSLKQSISYRKVLKELGVDKNISDKYLWFIAQTQLDSENKIDNQDSIDYYYDQIIYKHPLFKDIKERELIQLDEIQEHLSNSSALLHYFVSHDQIHCFTITADKYHWTITQKNKNLDESLPNYFKSLQDYSYIKTHMNEAEKEFISSGNLLFQVLLEPQASFLEEQNINDLNIVADDFIHEVSFVSLPIKKTGSWINPDIFLLNQYSVNHLYSTSDILGFNSEINDTISSSLAFGISYEDYSRGEDQNLQTLSYAIKETKKIGRAIKSDIVLEKKVTVGDFIASLKSSDLVHYSGHAVFDTSDYTRSFLPIYNAEGNTESIYYSDIISRNNSVKFLSLSACNTTNGQRIRSEGLIGMTRAFIEGGAKSCLGSLWNANDKSSYEISTAFYNQLKEGSKKPKALQQVRIQYLNDSDRSALQKLPIFWANWKLYGNPSSLVFEQKANYNNWIFIISGVLGVGLLIFFFRKK